MLPTPPVAPVTSTSLTFVPSNNSSWVDRLDYSNDTTAASVKGYLSAGTNDAGATGNPSFGYAGGGEQRS